MEEYDYEREEKNAEMEQNWELTQEIMNERAARAAQQQQQKIEYDISTEVAKELGYKSLEEYQMIVNSNPEAAKTAQETYKKIYKSGARSVMTSASNVARPRDAQGRFVKGTSAHIEGEAQPARAAQPSSNLDENVLQAKTKVNQGGRVRDDEINDMLEMLIKDFR